MKKVAKYSSILTKNEWDKLPKSYLYFLKPTRKFSIKKNNSILESDELLIGEKRPTVFVVVVFKLGNQWEEYLIDSKQVELLTFIGHVAYKTRVPRTLTRSGCTCTGQQFPVGLWGVCKEYAEDWNYGSLAGRDPCWRLCQVQGSHRLKVGMVVIQQREIDPRHPGFSSTRVGD